MAAIDRRGFALVPGGYVDVGGVLVYRFNAGERYRAQLAYLIKRKKIHDERVA